MNRLLSVWLLLVGVGHAQDIPKVHDGRLVITRFAQSPDIVHPIAVDFDAQGRLLVVESHTHFRPADYKGPKFDRVRRLEDKNGDGQAETFTTFYEGTTATMDLAVHPDGSVYLATRNEVLRLRDTNNDGVADEKSRVAFLETKGNYPHNGLSGLAFDSQGNLYFGMGENLGENYKLVGSDGTTLTGGGEGGNVYHCTATGAKLRRVATGFWNPFGTCRDRFGRLFVVDNDPDSSPPCRLLQLVEGADYGYQFRYGRAGRHPFQAWNGELPGTLPMVAGTGESPCEVLSYESDGLPAEYIGQLLVPAWADHRIERYAPTAKGAGFTGERLPFVTGGKEFRPSGLAVSPDGSLFISDWVSQSYNLHGKGAIWHVRWKEAPKKERPTKPSDAVLSVHRPTRDAAARTLAKDDSGRTILRTMLTSKSVQDRATALVALLDVNDPVDLLAIARTDEELGLRELALRALVVKGADVAAFTKATIPASLRSIACGAMTTEELLPLSVDSDPYLAHAAIQQLAKRGPALLKLDRTAILTAKQGAGLLLALRAWGQPEASALLPEFLSAADPTVQLLAAKWVADEQLVTHRGAIAHALAQPTLNTRLLHALATTLARLDKQPLNEEALAAVFVERLNDRKAPTALRVQALRAIPTSSKKLPTEQVLPLLRDHDEALTLEALRLLKDRGDPKALPVVQQIARDEKQSLALRAQAIVAWAGLGTPETTVLLDWATQADVVISTEAMRALAKAKLTAEQTERLQKVFPNNANRATMVKRTLGKPLYTDRPALNDIDGWLKRLEGPADIESGRRIFEHASVTTCAKCHRVDGRGADIGPDLSLIGRTERRWLLESILQPSNSVAPHFQAWRVETKDGKVRTGLLARTNLDETEYIDPTGSRFKVLAGDLESVTAAKESIMPTALVDGLTDQELRNLLAYLQSRR